MQSMITVSIALDMSAGSDFVNRSFIHPTSASRFKFRGFLKSRTAGKLLIRIGDIILLHIQIGSLRKRVWFEVDKDLAVKLLLGLSFIDKYVKGFFPKEPKLMSWHLWSFKILTKSLKTHNAVSSVEYKYG